jgi:hypothetical protein
MRTWTVALALLCISFGTIGRAARPWSVRIEWGSSIPAGTVYVVTIDGDGRLHAERKGLPFTSTGLTTATCDRQLRSGAAIGIRAAAEQFIRQLDFDKMQGHMVGDGGYASVQIWDGSANLTARFNLLQSSDEAGQQWNVLLSMVTQTLPPGFVR